jgi:sarcosine oxidase subunit beta
MTWCHSGYWRGAERPTTKGSYDCVVIGGGISGLAVAYELAKRGCGDVAVLEERYLGSGATGRCGSGIRAQFSGPNQIVLMREAEVMWSHLAEELDFEVHYRAGGYLWLWDTPELLEEARQNVALQNRYGVMSRIIDKQEALEICPELNPDCFLAGQWYDQDAQCFPFDAVTAYARAARRLGVDIIPMTKVIGLDKRGDRIATVHTTQGSIAASRVVNAAGAGSKELGAMVGIDLPVHLYKHQIMATEPIAQFLGPMIVKNPLYFLQTYRGNIVGGTGPGERDVSNVDSTFEFVTKFAHEVTDVMPLIAGVKMMRQWAGCSDYSPDEHPILGPVDGVPNFIQANGFSGHGFMMAPIVGRLLAEYIADGKPSIDIEPFNVRRFARGELLIERAVIGQAQQPV